MMRIGKMMHEKNITGLIDLLTEDDFNTRFMAAQALGEMKTEDTVNALINFLEGGQENSKLWAMIAIGRLGHETYYEPLKDILINSENELVVRRIAYILALTGRKEETDFIKKNIGKISKSLK